VNHHDRPWPILPANRAYALLLLVAALVSTPASAQTFSQLIAKPISSTGNPANVTFQVRRHGDINSLIRYVNKHVPAGAATKGRLARLAARGIISGPGILAILLAKDLLYDAGNDRFTKPGSIIERDGDATCALPRNQGSMRNCCYAQLPSVNCANPGGVTSKVEWATADTVVCRYDNVPSTQSYPDFSYPGLYSVQVDNAGSNSNCGQSRKMRWISGFTSTAVPNTREPASDDEVGQEAEPANDWPQAFDRAIKSGSWDSEMPANNGTETPGSDVKAWEELDTEKTTVEDYLRIRDPQDPAYDPQNPPSPEVLTEPEPFDQISPEPFTPGDSDPTVDPDQQEPGEPLSVEFPVFCTWASYVCDFIDWFTNDPGLPANPALPEETVGLTSWFSGWSEGSCPAPYESIYQGQTITISFDQACWAASTVFRPVLLVISFFIAGLIIVRN
jgi:hypothetical protein